MRSVLYRFCSLLLCLLLCLSAFCVNASAAYYDFGAAGEEEQPPMMARAIVNDSALHYDFWPVSFGWLRTDNTYLRIMDYTDFGFGDPIYPLDPSWTDYPDYKPRQAYIAFGAGYDVAISSNNVDELIDLGENTTNTITVDLDTTVDYLILKKVTVRLYTNTNNGDSSTTSPNTSMYKDISFSPMSTFNKNTDKFTIDFNTTGIYSRFGHVEFVFERSGASLGAERYIIIEDITIQDSETIEEKNFFSGLIDSVLNGLSIIYDGIVSIPDNIKGFFSTLLEGIKSLFLPADGYFQDKLSTLQKQAEEHLGLLYEIPAFVVGVIQSLIDHIAHAGNDRVIEYPALQYDGYTLIKAGSIDFQYYIDILEKYKIYTIYKTFVSVIGAIWFINFAYNKLQVIWGSDYDS